MDKKLENWAELLL